MNKIMTLCFVLSTSLMWSQAQMKRIQGNITDGFEPLHNVNISIKESDTGVKTDAEGKYSILAEEGQTLVYSYVGKQTIEIMVEDVTRFLNIEMFDRVEELKGVTVTKRKRKSQKELLEEYQSNSKLIKTGFGILDKERSGYSMRIKEGKDLSVAGQDFVDALQAWIPGTQVFRPTTFRPGGGSLNRVMRRPTNLAAPVVYLPRATRSANPVPAAFEVDGVVYTEAPVFISINNIERIAVLESLAGVARYGSLGAGGIVVINTKVGSFSKKEPGSQKPYDHAKLRNNYWDAEDLASADEMVVPRYLEKIQGAQNKEEAEQLFEEQEKNYANSPYFYLDALTFFNQEVPSKELSKRIVSTLERRFSFDPTVLKALAYQLEEMEDFEKANDIHRQIFILRPHYSQSYLDLANSFRDIENHETAATLYARYNYLVKESFFKKSETFSAILQNDFNNLLTQHGNLFGDNDTYVKIADNQFEGTRLVFEWNNSEAEFELQFVNPQGQYYTWDHSIRESSERIMEEKKSGFSSQEHLIYKPIGGTWRVNAKYLGNKSLTPTYLKVTIYHDFGSSNQKEEIRVFKLTDKNVNRALFSLDDSSRTTEQ